MRTMRTPCALRCGMPTPDWSLRKTDADARSHEIVDADNGVIASVLHANLLDEEPALPGRLPAGALVVRTGWLGDEQVLDDGARVWSSHPAQWLGSARERFDTGIARVLEQAGDREVWLWPHARHTLSDGPSVRRWLDDRAQAGLPAVGLLLEPTALLTEPMLGEREEHLDRVVQTVEVSAAVRGAIRGVICRGARAVEADGGIELAACAQSDGVVEADLVEATARRIADLAGAPVVRPLQ